MKLENLLDNIKISDIGIKKLIDNIKENEILMPEWNIPQLPKFYDHILDFQFFTFINSMNFCFIESDEKDRWRNKETGEYGAFGVFSALSKYFKTLINDKNEFEYEKLSHVDLKQMKEIFETKDGYGEMPLLEERVRIFHELAIGMVKFPFSRKKFTKEEFIDLLIESFPSYKDYIQYKGENIEVMKRGQLLIGMLVARNIITLESLENIDLCADYRVPQVLRELGILVYSKEIIEKLKNKVFIKEGDSIESEIRIATLAAGRIIREEFKKVGKIINCIELDYYLWISSRTLINPLEFHRTYSIKY